MSINIVTPISIDPINAPIGLEISITSTTLGSIADGTCMDSTYTTQIYVDSPLTFNTAIVGAGGLDQGTIAASSLYYVFLLQDSLGKNPVSSLLSLSANSFLMPAGYDTFKRIGVVIIDASSNLLAMEQRGSGNIRTYWFQEAQSVLGATASTGTFAEVDLFEWVPTFASIAYFTATFIPSAAGELCYLATIGEATPTIGTVQISGAVSTVAQNLQVFVPYGLDDISHPAIKYSTVATGTLALALQGFEDNLDATLVDVVSGGA